LETNRKSNQPKDEINEDRMDLDITDTKKNYKEPSSKNITTIQKKPGKTEKAKKK